MICADLNVEATEDLGDEMKNLDFAIFFVGSIWAIAWAIVRVVQTRSKM